MRNVSATLKRKIASRIQAGENAFALSLWVGRPTTPLVDDNFLEKQTILSSSNITKTSIAVCHPRLMRGATELYVGYIESGIIKIAKTNYVEEMDRHKWIQDIGYYQEADDFCLCFNGEMPKAQNGQVEFKTEQFPWVFWVLDEALYGRKLFDESEPFVLVESGCTKVSAIRAMWSNAGDFDFGLIVFFIVNGKLFYRQLVNGIWYDAEPVSFGPDNVTWSEIVAFRTWDYRIGLQCKDTNGVCYEMFTQFMGIAKQNAEHIALRDANASSEMIKIRYNNVSANENIKFGIATANTPHGGLYSTISPKLLSAENIDDNNGDWGKIIVAVFDNYLIGTQVPDNIAKFSLVDSWGTKYFPSYAELQQDDCTVVLTFTDFNAAYGECKLCYEPGTMQSIANILVEYTEVKFEPRNLNPPKADRPEVLSIWNE